MVILQQEFNERLIQLGETARLPMPRIQVCILRCYEFVLAYPWVPTQLGGERDPEPAGEARWATASASSPQPAREGEREPDLAGPRRGASMGARAAVPPSIGALAGRAPRAAPCAVQYY